MFEPALRRHVAARRWVEWSSSNYVGGTSFYVSVQTSSSRKKGSARRVVPAGNVSRSFSGLDINSTLFFQVAETATTLRKFPVKNKKFDLFSKVAVNYETNVHARALLTEETHTGVRSCTFSTKKRRGENSFKDFASILRNDVERSCATLSSLPEKSSRVSNEWNLLCVLRPSRWFRGSGEEDA